MNNSCGLSPLIRWVLAVTIAAMLTGCGDVNIQWQEEVRMADGEMLLVNRTAKGEKQGELGGSGGWEPTEMTLDIQVPTGWVVPPIWRTAYVPILLDYQSSEKTWNVVATFAYCQGWYDLGRPKLPYVEYQSRDGGPWEVIPLEERLLGWETNLLAGPRSGGEPELVTVEAKDKRNRSAADEYRKIVAKWQNNCAPN